WHDRSIYIADTYNHKIKKLNPETRELVTFIGTGQPGAVDGDRLSARLNEPNGLCVVRGKLLIADSNNHLIRSCDLKSGQVSTVVFKGLERLEHATPQAPPDERVLLKPVRFSTKTTNLALRLVLPAGTKLNPLGPSRVSATANDNRLIGLDGGSRDISQTNT